MITPSSSWAPPSAARDTSHFCCHYWISYFYRLWLWHFKWVASCLWDHYFLLHFSAYFFAWVLQVICSFCPPYWCVRIVSQFMVWAWHAGQWVVTGYTVATYLQWIHRIINDLISTFPIVALLGGWAGRRPAPHHHRCQREAINPEFKSTLLPQLVASCFCTHGYQLQENMKIQNFYWTTHMMCSCLIWVHTQRIESKWHGIK